MLIFSPLTFLLEKKTEAVRTGEEAGRQAVGSCLSEEGSIGAGLVGEPSRSY